MEKRIKDIEFMIEKIIDAGTELDKRIALLEKLNSQSKNKESSE